MKKIILTLLVGLMATVSGFAQSYTTNYSNYNTGQFKTWNAMYYSIKYPASWRTLTNFDYMSDVYIGSTNGKIGFTVLFFDTELSLSEVVNMGNVDMKKAGANVVSNKIITINGQTCYKTVFEYWMNGFHVKHISYTFKKGQKIFNVKFGSSYNEVNANAALIDEIIGSFKMK